MKTSELLKKLKLSNKKKLIHKIEIIVDGILISTITLPECASILLNSKIEVSKPSIELILTKSDNEDELELHKDEVYYVDLNNTSKDILYGGIAIGSDWI